MKITVSTLIDVPVAGVWNWYAVEHVRNHPRWDPQMELDQISDGPIGLGTRMRRRNRHFGDPIEGEMEIVEWEPERAMGARIHDAKRGHAWSCDVRAGGAKPDATYRRSRLREPR